MKSSEIRALSADELVVRLDELKRDLFMLRMQHATSQLDNPSRIQEAKRNIARVKTVMREQELSSGSEQR